MPVVNPEQQNVNYRVPCFHSTLTRLRLPGQVLQVYSLAILTGLYLVPCTFFLVLDL